MDFLYILLLICVMLAFGAQISVSSTFRKYSASSSGLGYSGSQVARRILDAHGLSHVRIECIGGTLTDHYDPRAEVLRLSKAVYDGSSASSVGVAAHEVGHAIQHSEGYLPVRIRTALVPAVNIASRFSWIAIMLGLLISYGSQVLGNYVLLVGVVLFSATTLFHLVTLPCEVNASGRALRELEYLGWYSKSELGDAKKVLRAAGMTYIASLAVSLLQLLRLVTLLGRRRR